MKIEFAGRAATTCMEDWPTGIQVMQAIGDGREQELQRTLDGASRSVRGLTRMRRQPSVQSRITARSESAEVGGLAVWLVLKEGRAVWRMRPLL